VHARAHANTGGYSVQPPPIRCDMCVEGFEINKPTTDKGESLLSFVLNRFFDLVANDPAVRDRFLQAIVRATESKMTAP